ncbi:MAG: JAB domain-containing protein, partial [Ruminococcus sp.]|nr:JAB domain-containing protein [Ruminococcus sp.]
FTSSESDMIEISDKKIYHFAKANNSERIFFAHCHPYGSSKPSQRDIDTTLKIKHTLNLLNITLVDHIVVGKDDATSIFEILKNNPEYKKDATKV